MAYTIMKSEPSEDVWAATCITDNHHEIRPAEHDGIEFNFDTSHRLQSRVAGHEVDLLPGRLMAFNARVEHTEIHHGTTLKNSAIILTSDFISDLFGDDQAPQRLVQKPLITTHPEVIRTAREIHRLSMSPFVPKSILNDLCTELALLVFQDTQLYIDKTRRDYYPTLIHRAKLHLINSIEDADVNLTALASHFGMSKFHFLRIFKKFAGLSPMKYLKQLRIDWFAHRLASEHRSVTELALASGYQSLSSFYDSFVKIHGRSPTRFFDLIKSNPNRIQVRTFDHLAVEV